MSRERKRHSPQQIVDTLGDAEALLGRGRIWHRAWTTRWRPVNRTIAWLHQFRHLRVRYERRDDIYEAFLTLGRVPIWYRCLQNTFDGGCP